MTTRPPAPDWYPDPSGKPGLRYWDGQRWHTDIPEAPPPVGEAPVESASVAPQPRRQGTLIALLVATVGVLAVGMGVAGYLLLRHPTSPQTSTATTPSGPTVQLAPPSGATAQPPPIPTPVPPASQYFKTQWGATCAVTAQQVSCQLCVPGESLPARQTCTDPVPAIAVNAAGAVDSHPETIDSSSATQQLSNGQTYHVNGWTIVASGGWVRFINDTTGHGMSRAPQNGDQF